jgi:beta-N-acetylhexosaminidase
MPGLDPGIHVLLSSGEGVDGRDKPGHDEEMIRARLAFDYSS